MSITVRARKCCVNGSLAALLSGLAAGVLWSCSGSGGAGTQLMGWQLSQNNTGLAGVGVDRNSLPLYEPPASEVQSGVWIVPANTTLSEKRIEVGGIDLSAGNITLERCWFHPLTIGRGMPLIYGTPTSPVIVRDSDIDGSGVAMNGDGTNPACGGFGINTSNVEIERCNIWGFGSGVGLSGQYSVNLEGTYIHDLVQGEWFVGSGESHQDGLTIRSFSGTSATIRNNRILINPSSKIATGAFFLQATWAESFFDNVLVEGNLFQGYGYNLGLDRAAGDYGTNLRVINNRFDPWENTGGWKGAAYIQHGGPGWAEWRKNHQNDPSQVDNQGVVIEEPLTDINAALTPPDNLEATPASSRSIRLSWSDNSDNETGFRIGRSLDGVAFFAVDIADANATSYVDTGLAANITYHYRIAAANRDGMSGYSNIATASISSSCPCSSFEGL